MDSTKHQLLNSLVEQVHGDAIGLKDTASKNTYFLPEQVKLMRDRATAILNKLDKYEELLK